MRTHSDEWYKARAIEINEKIKSMAEVLPVPGGVRANLNGHNISIFFWYKKCNYALNYKPCAVQKFTYGQEADIIRDEMIKVEKPLFTPPDVILTKQQIQAMPTENGVQLCIDHLVNKAERMGADNKAGAILKATAEELYQYL